MRKLSDLKGEDAIDVLADIIEPAAEIMADKEIVMMARAGERLRAVSTALKRHKKEVITILAVLEGEDPATYKPTFVAVPLKLLEILNDPDVVQVFTYQGQEMDSESSGSVMENTMEKGT